MTEPVMVTPVETNGNARVKKIAIAGGVLLLALVVGPKVLGGGGGGATTAFPSTPSTSAPAPGPKPDHVQTMAAPSGRDPFAPLMDVSSSEPAAPAGDAAATLTPSADVPLPAFEPVDLSGDPAAIGDPVAATPTTTTPPRPVHRLSLLEIFTDADGRTAARVRVDDAVMETHPSEDFGGMYRTISLDPASRCGAFLFGDTRISLCEGHEAIT